MSLSHSWQALKTYGVNECSVQPTPVIITLHLGCRRYRKLTSLSQRRYIYAESSHRDAVPFRKQLKDEAKLQRVTTHGLGERRIKISDDRLKEWQLTVGIEVHAQLNTDRKLFSRERQKRSL